MPESPTDVWIHIGECPVCVNGLCRVRTCDGGDVPRHFYAMCDECEALWLDPSTDTRRWFPDSSDPKCPICNENLYGPQANWSAPEDLQATDWGANAIFEVASGEIDGSLDFPEGESRDA